jgi:hypothetical protein
MKIPVRWPPRSARSLWQAQADRVGKRLGERQDFHRNFTQGVAAERDEARDRISISSSRPTSSVSPFAWTEFTVSRLATASIRPIWKLSGKRSRSSSHRQPPVNPRVRGRHGRAVSHLDRESGEPPRTGKTRLPCTDGKARPR